MTFAFGRNRFNIRLRLTQGSSGSFAKMLGVRFSGFGEVDIAALKPTISIGILVQSLLVTMLP
jgi:hypothetical protein